MQMRMKDKKTKRQTDKNDEEDDLETKMLEAAQATRYPPEADHKDNEEVKDQSHGFGNNMHYNVLCTMV